LARIDDVRDTELYVLGVRTLSTAAAQHSWRRRPAYAGHEMVTLA
jgi:hypothetical protein